MCLKIYQPYSITSTAISNPKLQCGKILSSIEKFTCKLFSLRLFFSFIVDNLQALTERVKSRTSSNNIWNGELFYLRSRRVNVFSIIIVIGEASEFDQELGIVNFVGYIKHGYQNSVVRMNRSPLTEMLYVKVEVPNGIYRDPCLRILRLEGARL